MRDHNKRSFPNDIHILESQVFNTEVFESALKGIDHVIYTLSIPEQYEHDTGIFYAVIRETHPVADEEGFSPYFRSLQRHADS